MRAANKTLRKHTRTTLRRASRHGGMYIDAVIAISILVIFTLAMSMMFPIVTTQQSLKQTARNAVRMAEITGRIGPEVEQVLTDADAAVPDTSVWETTFLDTDEQTIQFKTPIKLTLTKSVSLTLARPLMSDPMTYDLVVTVTADGISEVYWK